MLRLMCDIVTTETLEEMELRQPLLQFNRLWSRCKGGVTEDRINDVNHYGDNNQ